MKNNGETLYVVYRYVSSTSTSTRGGASCDLLGSDVLEGLRGRCSRVDPCRLVEVGYAARRTPAALVQGTDSTAAKSTSIDHIWRAEQSTPKYRVYRRTDLYSAYRK